MTSRTQAQAPPAAVAKTGIAGLDDVLRGGLPRNRVYLVQGEPGAGKTTVGLQFLLEGVAAGEKTLYLTLSETAEELEAAASSHGWSLENVAVQGAGGVRALRGGRREHALSSRRGGAARDHPNLDDGGRAHRALADRRRFADRVSSPLADPASGIAVRSRRSRTSSRAGIARSSSSTTRPRETSSSRASPTAS